MKVRIAKKNDAIEMFDVKDEALEIVVQRHLPVQAWSTETEQYAGNFNTELSVVADQELGHLHSVYTALACYAESKTAIADVEMAQAQANLDYISSVVLLSEHDDDEKVQQAKARVHIDPRVVEAQKRFLKTQAVYTLTKSKLESYNRCSACISREITRRGNEYPNLARNENAR